MQTHRFHLDARSHDGLFLGDAADYRQSVGLKYVMRGFDALFAFIPPLIVLAVGSFGALELLNLHRQGELQRLWTMALQTELTFDLVGLRSVELPYPHLRAAPCCHFACLGFVDIIAAATTAPHRSAQITVVGCISLVAAALLAYFMLQSRPVYMVDFQVYKAPDE